MSDEHGREAEESPPERISDPPELVRQMVQQWESQRIRLEAENEKLRETQRQLEQYRDRYVDLYDSAPLGYFTLDEDGYVQEANRAGVEMIGTDPNDLIGYPLLDYVDEADQVVFREHVRRCRQAGEVTKSEVTFRAKDGRQMVMQLHSVPIEAEDQDVALCKVAMIDITERKQVERQLRELNKALEQRVAEQLPQAQEQLLITATSRLSGLERHVGGERLRVLLADDHPIVRKGLAELLREDARIGLVAEACDGQEAVERARQLHPDVVILDISMPRLSGTDAAARIRAELPGTRIVGLSMHEPADMAETMLAAGAQAYVSKHAPAEELIAAVLGR